MRMLLKHDLAQGYRSSLNTYQPPEGNIFKFNVEMKKIVARVNWSDPQIDGHPDLQSTVRCWEHATM